jgi:hypothetical protein
MNVIPPFFSYTHPEHRNDNYFRSISFDGKEKDLCLNKGKGLAKQIYAITPDGS